MKIEEVRDLVANSTTPSEAVEAIESYLIRSQNSREAIHATVWLLVINQFQLRLRTWIPGNYNILGGLTPKDL